MNFAIGELSKPNGKAKLRLTPKEQEYLNIANDTAEESCHKCQ